MSGTDETSPLDVLWQGPTILWMMLIAEGLAVLLALALGVSSPFRFFGAISLATQWMVLATIAELYLLRFPLRNVKAHQIAYLALGLLILNAWLIAWMTRFAFEPAVTMNSDNWAALLVRLVGIVFTVGLLGLAAFQNHWRARQLAVRAKQSELEALQARVHPHFLFNTLNSVAALIHGRPADAERVLLDMADLFRAALAKPGWVLLEHELNLTRRYLHIEELRFGERLIIEWTLPNAIESAGLQVPLLTIQPLVENAIAHGVEPRRQPSRIAIRVEKTDAGLEIDIRNPLPEKTTAFRPPHEGHRVGLAAVRARVEDATNGQGAVTAVSTDDSFVATIQLPFASMPAA